MNLPARQQRALDQIERALQAADPRLTAMFAAFARLSPPPPGPSGRAARRRAPRIVTIVILVISLLGGMVALGAVATSKACPGLSSDQVVASAAVRYAACSKSTAAWSKGGR
jgi:hypothetical protein